MSRLVALSMRAAVWTVAVSSVGFAQAPASAVSQPIIEIRLASEQRAPGFDQRQVLDRTEGPRVLYLAPNTLLSDADMVRARTRRADDGIILDVVLTDSAAARLRETTTANVGRHVAVLASGRFAGAANILMSIPRGNTVTVGLTLPPEMADSVRARVEARWPARAR